MRSGGRSIACAMRCASVRLRVAVLVSLFLSPFLRCVLPLCPTVPPRSIAVWQNRAKHHTRDSAVSRVQLMANAARIVQRAAA